MTRHIFFFTAVAPSKTIGLKTNMLRIGIEFGKQKTMNIKPLWMESMNLVVLSGRLTKDPEIRYANNEAQTAVAHYTLAVNRGSKRDEADFIRCTAFGPSATVAEKYLRKGVRINVTGHIQTGSYMRENQKIFTTDVIVTNQEFCESKSQSAQPSPAPSAGSDRFMEIPDDIDSELPFA